MSEPISSISITYIIQHAVVAIFGGFAHAINQYRNGQAKSPMDFVLLTVLSSFFGVLFGFLAIHLYPHSEYLTMAIAGTGGWLGIESISIIMSLIKNRLK